MKVSELTGPLLDLWVAKAEGMEFVMHRGHPAKEVVFDPDLHAHDFDLKSFKAWIYFQPSSQWAEGGPIIEREEIELSSPGSPVHRHGGPNGGWGRSGLWSACTWKAGASGGRSISHHETSPLIAAMRCYVTHKFGNEVTQ